MKLDSNSGFTLVEVLVSLLVLGISLIALLGFHFKSGTINLENRQQTTAVLLAVERLEQLRAEAASGTLPQLGSVTENIERDAALYTLETLVEQDAGFAWRRNVTVNVQWARKGNSPGFLVLRSLIVENS